MKIFIPAFFLLLGTSFVSAQEIYNPIQMDNPLSFISDDAAAPLIAPDWNIQFKEKFSMIRVKVFPHNSQYNAPHGRDAVTDRFTLSSNGDCQVFKSEFSTSENGISREHLIKTGKTFEFTISNLTSPIWVECSQDFELKRVDYIEKPVRYAGVLFIKKVDSEKPYLTAVNVLPFEQYLKGVVPSEMPASWSVEVLRAQAIAARTYAYYELGIDVASQDKNLLIEKSGAQIDDTVTYQAYLGLKNAAASTNRAVDETAGYVMVHENKVIKAYFHADSGGYTENAENVWGLYHPYIIGKAELYPEGSIPGTNWGYVAKIKDIEKKLIDVGVLHAADLLESLSIDSHNLYPSSRPKYIDLKLATGVSKRISAVRYSFIMGLKSQWIKFSPASDLSLITVSGKGFGHGAGMNQWGARHLVDKMKMKFDEVLKFYYTDIQIVR